MSDAKPAPVSPMPAKQWDDDPVVRSLERAPVDGDAFDADEISHLEAIDDEPMGQRVSTAEVLTQIAERAKREG